mmetsp:Transcript_1455/g.4741  ORF Transcript_1455/g.4741 Transcript_1455/m.4741 type:complete len:1203 (-) Transcript_1455:776-4384(-)
MPPAAALAPLLLTTSQRRVGAPLSTRLLVGSGPRTNSLVAGGFTLPFLVVMILAPSFVSTFPVHPFDSVSVKSASSSSTTGLFASTHLYVITPDPRRLKYRRALSGASTDFGSSGPQAWGPLTSELSLWRRRLSANAVGARSKPSTAWSRNRRGAIIFHSLTRRNRFSLLWLEGRPFGRAVPPYKNFSPIGDCLARQISWLASPRLLHGGLPLRLLAFVLVQLFLDLADEFVLEILKVPVVVLNDAVVDDPNLAALGVVANPAKKPRIVTNNDHTSLEFLERVRQRVDGLHVQMVGGLIEEQDVRVGQGDGGKDDPGLLSSGKLHDWLKMVVSGQPKFAELCADLLRAEAAHALQILNGRHVKRQSIDEMLIVPSNTELVALALISLCRLQIASEQVHERRLAGTVWPDNDHPGPHVNTDVEIRETEIVPSRILERSIHKLEKLGRRELGRLGELELDGVVVPLPWRGGRRLATALIPTLSSLLSFLLGLLGNLVRLVPRPALLRRLHLLLVLLKLLVHLPPLLLVHVLERLEVPTIVVEALVVQMDDVSGDRVQEIAVVRHDDQRLLPARQVLLQPQHRPQIQVICRFIEQQHRRLDVQRSCQGNTHPPPSTEQVGCSLLHLLREPQPVQNLGRPCLGRRAPQLVHPIVNLRQSIPQPFLVLVLQLHVVQLFVQLGLLLPQAVELHVRRHHALQRRIVGPHHLLLHQQHVQVLRHRHLATGNHPHDRRLSLSVGTHQPIATPGSDGQRRVLQQNLTLGPDRHLMHLDVGRRQGRVLPRLLVRHVKHVVVVAQGLRLHRRSFLHHFPLLICHPLGVFCARPLRQEYFLGRLLALHLLLVLRALRVGRREIQVAEVRVLALWGLVKRRELALGLGLCPVCPVCLAKDSRPVNQVEDENLRNDDADVGDRVEHGQVGPAHARVADAVVKVSERGEHERGGEGGDEAEGDEAGKGEGGACDVRHANREIEDQYRGQKGHEEPDFESSQPRAERVGARGPPAGDERRDELDGKLDEYQAGEGLLADALLEEFECGYGLCREHGKPAHDEEHAEEPDSRELDGAQQLRVGLADCSIRGCRGMSLDPGTLDGWNPVILLVRIAFPIHRIYGSLQADAVLGVAQFPPGDARHVGWSLPQTFHVSPTDVTKLSEIIFQDADTHINHARPVHRPPLLLEQRNHDRHHHVDPAPPEQIPAQGHDLPCRPEPL